MGDDAVDILSGMRTVVVGLQEDDMCAGFAREVSADLGFIGFFFEHRDRYEESAKRLDIHRRRDEDIGTSLLATFVQMMLDGAGFVFALNQLNIFVIIPNHYLAIIQHSDQFQ